MKCVSGKSVCQFCFELFSAGYVVSFVCLTPCIMRQITNALEFGIFFFKFIYLFIAQTCFGYSLAITRVLVIWYSGRTMCIFSKIHLLTLIFFSYNLPRVQIINKILKMFCCLTLVCNKIEQGEKTN